MSRRFFVIFTVVCLAFSGLAISYLLQKKTKPVYQGKVYIKNEGERYTLIRNGTPFFIKGGSGFTHIDKLSEIGGNTIKTWDTTNVAQILDEAHHHNIAVIVGFNMLPSQYNDLYYADQENVEQQYRAFRDFVLRHKDHPALLMWCLGNELEFRLKYEYKEFYTAYKSLMKMIRETDPDHPVTTTFYDRGRQDLATFRLLDLDLDLVATNRFGNLSTFTEELDKDAWLWNWPFMITEWGIVGPWEKKKTMWGAPLEDFDSVKAERLRYVYDHYFPHENPAFLGAMVFFWGQKQERTHTWFSLFDSEGNTSRSVEIIQDIYSGTQPDNLAPYVTEMKLENKEAQDDIVLRPGIPVEVRIKTHDPDGDTLTCTWEISKEQWYYTTRVENEIPENIEGLILKTGNTEMTFTTPAEKGPYRVFVHVTDNKGHFGTANIPFYIMD